MKNRKLRIVLVASIISGILIGISLFLAYVIFKPEYSGDLLIREQKEYLEIFLLLFAVILIAILFFGKLGFDKSIRKKNSIGKLEPIPEEYFIDHSFFYYTVTLALSFIILLLLVVSYIL